jgi:hypothetical protein
MLLSKVTTSSSDSFQFTTCRVIIWEVLPDGWKESSPWQPEWGAVPKDIKGAPYTEPLLICEPCNNLQDKLYKEVHADQLEPIKSHSLSQTSDLLKSSSSASSSSSSSSSPKAEKKKFREEDVVKMQAAFRGYHARKELQNLKRYNSAVVQIQSIIRSHNIRKAYIQKKSAILVFQSFCRTHKVLKMVTPLCECHWITLYLYSLD